MLGLTNNATAQDEAGGGWLELGVNLRTDFGVHALRADLGFRYGNHSILLVLDPMFWADGQTSSDLIYFRVRDGFQPMVGYRLNTVPALDGSQLQHNAILGTALNFPPFWDGRIRGQWGLEMAMVLLKNGGGLPVETIAFDSGRHYIDLVNFGMYARFDYNLRLLP